MTEWQETLKSNPIVIADFYATWCPPCKAAAPKFAQWSQEWDPKTIAFCKVNVDECRDVSSAVGITAMPTFKLYKAGKEESSVRGYSAGKILAMIEQSGAAKGSFPTATPEPKSH